MSSPCRTETYLKAGISLVPLAPLTNVTEADLPGLIRRMEQQIDKQPKRRAGKLWTATNVLMGLRYPEELVSQLLKGKMEAMRESTTYQAILQEGRQEGITLGREEGITVGEQQALLRQGTKRFGPPGPATVTAIEAIHDMGRLGTLLDRILELNIQSWDDLLRTP
jgi:predicted transposase YdaD